jgi:O-antigen ligase
VNGAFTIRNAVSGQTQAGGMLGHRNYSGLVTNLAVPILLGAVLTWKKARVPALALAFAAVSAALGGSRAALVLFGVSVALTLFLALLVGKNRKVVTVTAIAALGSLVMVPVAAYKMQQRFEQTGGSFTFEEDGERLAFRRASAMMNADYPLGIGLNQYAVKSNAGGYAAEAGVGWSTIGRTAIVHNSYILIRTEGGHAALFGVFIMLGSLISVSLALLIRNRSRDIRIYAASVFVAISVLSLHLNYEWSLVGIHVIYALAFCSALAGLMLKAPQAKRQRSTPGPIMVATKRRPKSL